MFHIKSSPIINAIGLISLSISSASFANISQQDIVAMHIPELRAALDNKELTSEQIVQAYLDEIKKEDKSINAVITINPKALEQARAWDAHHEKAPAGHVSLGGIPFMAKDNYDTKGVLTTGGNLALSDSVPETNAFVVQKLLDDGAILLAKTNMSELASSFGRPGYSSVGGLTLNPANLLRNSSGSSSGSASAVAAHLAPFALGTDTSGSVRGPAAVTGTVGLRPTLGLTSRSGIIPLSLTFDTAGVITTNIADQAIVMDVIKGEDPTDAATKLAHRPSDSFYQELTSASFKGKTIGVLTNFREGNEEVNQRIDDAVAKMEKAGAHIVPITMPASFDNLYGAVMAPIGKEEFKPQFNAYLATLPKNEPHTMTEFMKILAKKTDNGSKVINPGRYTGLEKNYNSVNSSPEYIRVLTRKIPAVRDVIDNRFNENGLDALVFATTSCPASPAYGKKDPSYVCNMKSGFLATRMASISGYPEVTVPAGRITANMPVGISFLGKRNEDGKVLQFGFAFEKLN